MTEKILEIQSLYEKSKSKIGVILSLKNQKIIVKSKLGTRLLTSFYTCGIFSIALFLFLNLVEVSDGQIISFLAGLGFFIFLVYIGLESFYKSFLYYSFDLKNKTISKYFFYKQISSKNFSDISLIINDFESVKHTLTQKDYTIYFNDNLLYKLATFTNKEKSRLFSDFIKTILGDYNNDSFEQETQDSNIYEDNEYIKEDTTLVSIFNEDSSTESESFSKYYEPNINYSITSVIVTTILSFITSVLAGIFYVKTLSFFSSSKYYIVASIISPILLGSIIAIETSYFMKFFKSNNIKDTIKISVISALLSLYTAWIYLLNFNQYINTIFLSPIQLIKAILLYSTNINYDMIFFNVSGKYSFLVWFLELSTIIYYSFSRTKIEMKKSLLCNDCNNWCSMDQLKFNAIERNQLNNIFVKWDLSVLKKMTNFNNYLRLTIYSCNHCKKTFVLDAVNLIGSNDSDTNFNI